jgi:hypothetical protein
MTLAIDNTVDPLSVLKEGRELSTCPRHFVVIKCDSSIMQARNWIWKNLVGRFSAQANFVAFEDPSEASMFAMIRDQFAVNDKF